MTRYYSVRSAAGPWDYIVIGSGMGGMTSAALLSRLGRRVLLLEQHVVPGGLTHSFRRRRWSWDVGVHAVGQVTEHSMVGRLLNRLTDGKLVWESLGPVYDEIHFPDGSQFSFPDDPEHLRESLHRSFPRDRQAIDCYLQEVHDVAASIRGFYLARLAPRWLAPVTGPLFARRGQRYFQLRTKEVLDRLSGNERLKATLTAQWGYYGVPPHQSSFAMHAMMAHSFRHGAYYPRGGSARIAECMLTPLARSGGAVRVRADVRQIMVRGGKAIGVRLQDGEEIRADRVISAAGALATIRHLLPESERQHPWARAISALSPSRACTCLHIGFKGDIRKAGASSARHFYYESPDAESQSWDFRDTSRAAPGLYASFSSLSNPEHDPGPEELHTGMLITFVPWQPFQPWEGTRWMKRGEEYAALKEELSRRLLDQFLANMPDLRPMIAFHELSTPLTTMHFTRAVQGAIYGIEPTPTRFANPWLRQQTPVKNLYLSGCDAGLPGVVGALVGGVLAVLAAEPVGAVGYLRSL